MTDGAITAPARILNWAIVSKIYESKISPSLSLHCRRGRVAKERYYVLCASADAVDAAAASRQRRSLSLSLSLSLSYLAHLGGENFHHISASCVVERYLRVMVDRHVEIIQP